MRIIGVDLHTRQQSVAMLDTDTREVVNAAIKHEGNIVREFYGNLRRPARCGIDCAAIFRERIRTYMTRALAAKGLLHPAYSSR
jgi:hypothetical protein